MTNIKPPHEIIGAAIPFDRLTAADMRLVQAIADRACAVVVAWLRAHNVTCDDLLDRDKLIIQMDIATAHLSRNLELLRFLLADDLQFFEEFVNITKSIDRTCGKIPDDVKLRFALLGATFANSATH